MPEQSVTLMNEVGLHARPAAQFSKAARAIEAEVTVIKGEREANAKSLLSVLSLDVRQGDSVVLRVHGPGADGALAELVRLLESL